MTILVYNMFQYLTHVSIYRIVNPCFYFQNNVVPCDVNVGQHRVYLPSSQQTYLSATHIFFSEIDRKLPTLTFTVENRKLGFSYETNRFTLLLQFEWPTATARPPRAAFAQSPTTPSTILRRFQHDHNS